MLSLSDVFVSDGVCFAARPPSVWFEPTDDKLKEKTRKMQILSRRTQRVSERYDENEDDERMESVCRESKSLFSSSVLYCFNVSSILFIALNSSDVTSSFYGPILILFFYFYLRFLFCFMALIHFNYPYSFFVSVCSYNLCLSLYERLFLVIRTQIMSLFSVLFAETFLFIKSPGPCREVTVFSC